MLPHSLSCKVRCQGEAHRPWFKSVTCSWGSSICRPCAGCYNVHYIDQNKSCCFKLSKHFRNPGSARLGTLRPFRKPLQGLLMVCSGQALCFASSRSFGFLQRYAASSLPFRQQSWPCYSQGRALHIGSLPVRLAATSDDHSADLDIYPQAREVLQFW